MKTRHQFLVGDSRYKILEDETVDLVVTSPPYPMIEMWDSVFANMNSKIDFGKPMEAFNLMNLELKKVYQNVYKALKPGGIMVVNIGDATRTINKIFRLYPNGAKTIEMCLEIGFDVLPQIYWWKPTNSPNKFMGSGMYPVGAYVTLETEHVLIFRKGIRNFANTSLKSVRQESAFFQNERNLWFSSIWTDIKGTSQKVSGLGRERNAAFPLELAYRLINMFSIKGDLVWDPFGGTGTTSIAAIVAGRNSVVNDIDESFIEYSKKRVLALSVENLNKIIVQRINESVQNCIKKYKEKMKEPKYINKNYGEVYTMQELNIKINQLESIIKHSDFIEANYFA